MPRRNSARGKRAKTGNVVPKFSEAEERFLIDIKEGGGAKLSWDEISDLHTRRFPTTPRTKGGLQVHYSRSLQPKHRLSGGGRKHLTDEQTQISHGEDDADANVMSDLSSSAASNDTTPTEHGVSQMSISKLSLVPKDKPLDPLKYGTSTALEPVNTPTSTNFAKKPTFDEQVASIVQSGRPRAVRVPKGKEPFYIPKKNPQPLSNEISMPPSAQQQPQSGVGNVTFKKNTIKLNFTKSTQPSVASATGTSHDVGNNMDTAVEDHRYAPESSAPASGRKILQPRSRKPRKPAVKEPIEPVILEEYKGSEDDKWELIDPRTIDRNNPKIPKLIWHHGPSRVVEYSANGPSYRVRSLKEGEKQIDWDAKAKAEAKARAKKDKKNAKRKAAKAAKAANGAKAKVVEEETVKDEDVDEEEVVAEEDDASDDEMEEEEEEEEEEAADDD